MDSPASRDALVHALDTLGVGRFVIDPDDIIVDANEVAARLLHRELDDLIGAPSTTVRPHGPRSNRAAAARTRAVIGPIPRQFETDDGPISMNTIVHADEAGFTTVLLLAIDDRRTPTVARHHQAAIDRLPVGVLEIELGEDTIRTNRAVDDMLGVRLRTVNDLQTHLVDPDEFEQMVDDLYDTVVSGHSGEAEFELLGGDGRIIPVRSRTHLIPASAGSSAFLVITLEDLTESIEQARTTSRLYDIVDATTDLVGLVDPSTGEILYLNESARELTGRDGNGPVFAAALFTDDSVARFRPDLMAGVEADGSWRGDLELLTPAGVRILDMSVFRSEGDGLLAILGRDVTAARASAAELAHRANHDELTGLLNRTGLLETLADYGDRSTRYALLYLDLDRFKPVNDTHGHAAGDELLIAVARRLQREVRVGDLVARIGGDEFVVAAPDVDADTAHDLADRLRAAIAEPFGTSAGRHSTTTSVGVAMSAPGEEPEAVLRDADAALYEAKSAGRARVEFFSASMRTERHTRNQLADDLREAIDRDELDVAYQPLVSMADGRIVGVEALARWTHPLRGAVGPDVFIPLAEQRRFINEVDRFVWHRAVTDLTTTALLGVGDTTTPLRLHANLSAWHLARREDVVASVEGLLAETGFDPSRLCLEVTESALVTDEERAARTIRELRELGIEIAIDDFGTGYSGLGLLARFDLDVLKIDRSFVDQITDAGPGEAIARTVVDLARALGLGIVAEGVEREAQAERLAAMGCTEAQGYLYDRPMTIDALRTRLAEPGARV